MLRRSSNRDGWGRFIDLGLQFAVAVGAGMGLGYWLDHKWHTAPFLMLAGLLLGATSGFLNIYRAVFPASQNHGDQERHHEQ